MKRFVIHSDLNSFFASVEIMKRPWLKYMPVAVTGDNEKRHGIVLAKNILAASYGIKTAEPTWIAMKKCPSLITVPPTYDDYMVISKNVRKIYEEYSDNVEPFGIDECWIDISNLACSYQEAEEIADEIRKKIHASFGITASCGVSFNKVFAKLASDLRKPDLTTVITEDDFKEKIWSLPADKLLFIGRSTTKALSSINIQTIGDLANTDVKVLEFVFGKCGISMWLNANGLDSSPVLDTKIQIPIKSVSNSITLPRDIIDDCDIRAVLMALSEKVSCRMRKAELLCNTVQLYVRDFEFLSYERQARLEIPNRTVACLFHESYELFKINHISGKPVRALGLRACNLCSDNEEQMTIFKQSNIIYRHESADMTADCIRNKFGKNAIQRGLILASDVISVTQISDERLSFAKTMDM